MYITPKVPMMDIGNAKLGINVAERLRRNRKITRITSAMARNSVNFTSATELRMDSDASYSVAISMDGGMIARNCGSSFFTASTTSTVFVPGWRSIASTTEAVSFHQFATRLF